MNNICVNNEKIQVKEYEGFKVVTFEDIDRVHKRAKGTARRNFNTNKKHFILNEDFFEISRIEFSTKFVPNSKIVGNPNLKIILITQTGYLMLVKSFTDDLSWNVQKILVNNYFNQSLPQQTQMKLPEPYRLIKKTYKGEPVMVIEDLANIFGFNKAMMYYYVDKFNINCKLLRFEELKLFKKENPMINPNYGSLLILNRKNAIELSKKLKMTEKQKELIEYFGYPITPIEINQKEDVYIPTETQLKQAELLIKVTDDMDYDFKHFFREYATYLIIGKTDYKRYELALKLKNLKKEFKTIDKDCVLEAINEHKQSDEYKNLSDYAKQYIDEMYREILA